MTTITPVKPKIDKKMLLHVAVTFCLMFGFQLIPAPAPITTYGMMTIGIFAGLIYGWTMSSSNMVWPALMGMVALGLSDFGTCSTVMIKAFGSDIIVLNIAGMLMIGALTETGVSEWLIVKLVTAKFAKERPWVLTFVLVVGPFVLALLLSSILIAIFLLSLYGTMFKQAKYERGDKYVCMVSIGMTISMLLSTVVFPFKGSMLMFLPVISASSGIVFDHAKYMMAVIPFCVLTSILYVPLMKLMGCNPSKILEADTSEIEAKYQYGLSSYQKAILYCVIVFVFGAIVVSFAGGDEGIRLLLKKFGVYGWSMLMCAIMMVIRLDNKALVDPNIVGKHVSWGILFVIASATVVSGAMTSEETGVSAFLSQLVSPIMSGLNPVVFLFVVGLVTFLATNVLNNLATIYTMIAVVCALFVQGLNFNMEIAGIMIPIFGLLGFLLPGSSIYGAFIHSQEYTTPKQLYIYGGISMVYVIVCMMVIFLPWALFIY